MPEIISYFRMWEIDKLGIGSFGPLCLEKRNEKYGYILETPKLAWRNYDILGVLENGLHIPCYLDTDVNAAALGEATWGNASDVKNSIYITVGTGIGAGIIVDRRPVHGLMHPEAGHIFVKRSEKDRFLGSCPYHHDCLEGVVSRQAIVNYILILSSQRVILGGSVMHQEQLIPMIRQEVKQLLAGYIFMSELEDLEHFIVPPKLQDNEGIMGCIQLTQME